jgi:hypothetical protein
MCELINQLIRPEQIQLSKTADRYSPRSFLNMLGRRRDWQSLCASTLEHHGDSFTSKYLRLIMAYFGLNDTYDHRSVRTGHPVRSAIHKH